MEQEEKTFRCLAAIAGECHRKYCPEFHEHSLEDCNLKDNYCLMEEIGMSCTSQERKLQKGREDICFKCEDRFTKKCPRFLKGDEE